jgi:hypothetical protein
MPAGHQKGIRFGLDVPDRVPPGSNEYIHFVAYTESLDPRPSNPRALLPDIEITVQTKTYNSEIAVCRPLAFG